MRLLWNSITEISNLFVAIAMKKRRQGNEGSKREKEGETQFPAWRCKANDVILKTILEKHFTPGIIFSRLLRKCTDYTRRQRYCSREEIKRNKTLGNLSSDCFARNPPRERTARKSWHARELLDTLFVRKCTLHVDSTLNSRVFDLVTSSRRNPNTVE